MALTFEIDSIPSLSWLSDAKGRWRKGRNHTFIFRTSSCSHTEVLPPGPLDILCLDLISAACLQGPSEASRALCKPQTHTCLSGQVEHLLSVSEGEGHKTKVAPFRFPAENQAVSFTSALLPALHLRNEHLLSRGASAGAGGLILPHPLGQFQLSGPQLCLAVSPYSCWAFLLPLRKEREDWQ